MRITYSLFVVAALITFGATANVSARGPFDLFSGSACCDSPCDRCGCDSAGCETDNCDSLGKVCCDSGCDSIDCGKLSCGPAHSLENLLRIDCCCSRTYFSVLGGWNSLDDYNGNDFEFPVPPPTPAIRRGSFSDGWMIGAAGGRKLNQAIRAELEFAFRSNTADQWFVNGNPAGQWSGHFYSYSIMANLYHDFASCGRMGWIPYVGGGLGIAFLDGDFTTTTLDLEISDEEFAYQFIVGGSKSLTSNVDAFLEYRYFATTNFDLVNNTPALPVEFGEDPYEANNLFVGLRLYR